MANVFDSVVVFVDDEAILDRIESEFPSEASAELECAHFRSMSLRRLPGRLLCNLSTKSGPPDGWVQLLMDRFPAAEIHYISDDYGGSDFASYVRVIQAEVVFVGSTISASADDSPYWDWLVSAGFQPPEDPQASRHLTYPQYEHPMRPEGCVSERHADSWVDRGRRRACVTCHPISGEYAGSARQDSTDGVA